MIPRPTHRAGVTLVELLAVLGIVATIAVIAIPLIGSLQPDASQLASRELFNVLRAAQLYATTYNVDAAVAYVVAMSGDSRDEEIDPVPIVDALIVVRRLTREEYIDLGLVDIQLLSTFGYSRDGERPFIKIASGSDDFQFLPNDSCILPELFEYEIVNSQPQSVKGLTTVHIWDEDIRDLVQPRRDHLTYTIEDSDPDQFPAHQFSSDGGMITNDFRQRYTFNVGVRPDADPADRFSRDLDDTDIVIELEKIDIWFNQDIQDYERLYVQEDPEELYDFEDNSISIDLDSEMTLYVPTGRVKVESGS